MFNWLLVNNSQILILVCALNCESRHIVNREVIDVLGRDGIIVNIGRDSLIDEDELVSALVEGRLRGAGLDVLENEPEVPELLVGNDAAGVHILTSHCFILREYVFLKKSEINGIHVRRNRILQEMIVEMTRKRKLMAYAQQMVGRGYVAAATDQYDHCSKKNMRSLISYSGVHQLHIFIFVLAVMHVFYSGILMALGQAKA